MIKKGIAKGRMLTTRQERFVQELIKGKSQRQAYLAAYPNSKKWKETTVDSKASTLLKNGKVKERYEELKKLTEEKVTYDAAQVKDQIIGLCLSIMNADVMSGDVDGKAVKNKRWDSRNRVIYEHYDKMDAAKMLISLLGIENTADDDGIHIHLHSSEDYDG